MPIGRDGRDYKVTYQAAAPVALTFLVVLLDFFNNGTHVEVAFVSAEFRHC